MHRQRGTSLQSLLLGLSLVALMASATLPALYQWYGRMQTKHQLVSTVTDTLAAMERAQARHWANTQCRVAPTTVTLGALVTDYQAPASILASPWPLAITFTQTATAPALSRGLAVTVTAASPGDASRMVSWLSRPGHLIALQGNEVRVERPVTPVATLGEQQHFNPATGCMEAP